MKYQLIALPALAATVAAQDLNSIIQVLQTALPSSLVAEALTNSAAVGSEIASQFAAGATPTWFTALPSDIQGYLVPTDLAGVSSLTAAASSLASSAGLSNVTSSVSTPITTAPGVIGTGTLISNGTIIGTNGSSSGNSSSSLSKTLSSSTTRSGSSSSSTSGSDSDSSSSSGSDSSSSVSDAGAAMPTAFFGMGLAGAVGLVGVLAL